MNKNIRTLLLNVWLMSLPVLMGCGRNSERNIQPTEWHKELFREGDIVFRRGTGIASRVILASDRKGTYSHIGILKNENGEWYVIHAVPGEPDFKDDPDRVKKERIEQFFDSEKATCGAVMRVQGDSIKNTHAAENALRIYRANTLFDHEYNLKDTVKMYCTELVEFVYRKEGVDLTEGRISNLSVPGFSGEYILPSDIEQSHQLRLIYQF